MTFLIDKGAQPPPRPPPLRRYSAATPLRPHWSALPHAPPPPRRLDKAGLCVIAHALCEGCARGDREMFRRAPRNFRGRRRAASSGSSCGSDGERGSTSALPPDRDPDEEAESGESDGDRGGAASSSEGARTAAERPLPSAEPARGAGAVLSFGSDEEERGGGRLGGG